MRRVMLMLCALAMVVGLLAGPVAAAPGGNAANAAKCEEGGYLDYTDAQGNPFKNEGQCTSYAARGGQLVPVMVLSLEITITYQGFDTGTISGTGFTPNSQIRVTRTYLPSGETIPSDIFTDATGAFTLGDDFDFASSTPTRAFRWQPLIARGSEPRSPWSSVVVVHSDRVGE